MSSNFTVIYDANILFGAFRRNVMMHLAQSGIFRARWSEDIHLEWMRNLKKSYPNLDTEKVQRLRELIDSVVPDCLVTGYRRLIEGLELPDPDDRHVLAAAIKAGAQVIVTYNTKDFPDEILQEFDIQAQHPDDFIMYQRQEDLEVVLLQLRLCKKSYKNPPLSVQDFIEKVKRNDLARTADWLTEVQDLLL